MRIEIKELLDLDPRVDNWSDLSPVARIVEGALMFSVAIKLMRVSNPFRMTEAEWSRESGL